jgi:hypothetical protein
MTRWRLGERIEAPPLTVHAVMVDVTAYAEGCERRLRVSLGTPVNHVDGHGDLWFGPRGAMRPILDAEDLNTHERVHLDASAHDVITTELHERGLLA